MGSTAFTYTARNQKASETDRLGHTSTFSYDPAGNLLTISDAENEAKKATVTPEVYEAGKTRYTYTERNQLETERFPGETAARSYTYHPNGQLKTRTDQRGIVTTYGYDGANRLTTRAYSDAPADAFVLDDAGRITTATSGRYGTVVERTWKPTGLIETETTTWPADISGVTSSTLVQYGYDAANRGVSVTYPGGATLVRTFTARNQLDTLTLGTQLQATAGHDDAGRRTSLLYGNGLTDTRTYTDDNRLEGAVVAAAAPAAPVVSLGYQYDANRRKTDETDAITTTRSQHFGYDDADRLTSWNTGSATQAWTLSAVGDWTNTTVNGVIENRDHTAVHEIAKINDVLVLHDAAGNLARTAQGQGFSWDAENRLLMANIAPNSEKTQGQAFYWYDALGRRVAKRVHDSVTRYVHDGWQVIQELDAPVVATPAEAASDGPLTNLATVPDGALLYPTFDADGTRHDPVRVNFQPETTAIPAGFIADKGRLYDTRTNGLSYGWQGAAERPAHTVRHFHPLPQYDTFGPVASSTDTWTWQIALPNGTYPVAIVAGDATSLAHTNNLVVNGQPLEVDPDPGNDTTIPTYERGDFDGWLVQVQVTDGVLTITAGAEAFNPTLTHIEIGAEGQAITPEMQQRLADQILAATQRTGGSPFWNGGRTETRNYVWDPSYVDALVAYQRTTESGTETFCVHSGAQYSVQAVTDSNGNVVERYSYDAYGTRTIEGASNGGRSSIGLTTAFSGRALDEETGLYYFRNRMYSAKDGRFVSRDPMGYVDGMSLYRGYFVPRRVDPTGYSTTWSMSATNAIKDPSVQARLEAPMLSIEASVGVDADMNRGSVAFATSVYLESTQMRMPNMDVVTIGSHSRIVPGVGTDAPGYVGTHMSLRTKPKDGCPKVYGVTQKANWIQVYHSDWLGGGKPYMMGSESDWRIDSGGDPTRPHNGWYDPTNQAGPTTDSTDIPGFDASSWVSRGRTPTLLVQLLKTEIRVNDEGWSPSDVQVVDWNKPPLATIYWMSMASFTLDAKTASTITSTEVYTFGSMYAGAGPAGNPMQDQMDTVERLRAKAKSEGIFEAKQRW